MIDGSAELCTAIRAALVADTDVAAIVGGRISTDPGLVLEPPFIRLAVPNATTFNDDRYGAGSEYRVELRLFTRESGFAANATLASLVRAALDEKALPMATSAMWWLLFSELLRFTDPDDPGLQVARLTFTSASTDGN